MTTIHDELDREFAPAWKPQPGEKLVGTVTELSERDGAYGTYPIVTLATEHDERFALHAFHEVLASELSRVAPKIGDVIGVKYAGKDPDKGYHRYRVRKESDDADFSWSKYGETAPSSDVAADTADLSAGGGSGSDDDLPF